MNKLIYFILIFILFISCSKQELKKSGIKEKFDMQVLEAYEEGLVSLE